MYHTVKHCLKDRRKWCVDFSYGIFIYHISENNWSISLHSSCSYLIDELILDLKYCFVVIIKGKTNQP